LGIWFSILLTLALPATADEFRTKDGTLRQYERFQPAGTRNQKLPVLFVLHGGGGTAKAIHKGLSFDALARRTPTLVIYPQGLRRHWNDGRNKIEQKVFKGPAPNDVAFLRALARELIAKGQADPDRIWVVGVSNGGMMTQRLLCEASDTFVGGVSMIANLPASLRGCTPDQPRPVLMINGDADPLMPWGGGGVGFRHSRGQVLSTMDSFRHWQALNGCAGSGETLPFPDVDQDDHSRAYHTVSSGCTSGQQVQLIRIEGGGHTVPGVHKKRHGFRGRRLKKLLGPTNQDFEAKELAWQFLQK